MKVILSAEKHTSLAAKLKKIPRRHGDPRVNPNVHAPRNGQRKLATPPPRILGCHRCFLFQKRASDDWSESKGLYALTVNAAVSYRDLGETARTEALAVRVT